MSRGGRGGASCPSGPATQASRSPVARTASRVNGGVAAVDWLAGGDAVGSCQKPRELTTADGGGAGLQLSEASENSAAGAGPAAPPMAAPAPRRERGNATAAPPWAGAGA